MQKLNYLKAALTADVYSGSQISSILTAGGFKRGGRGLRDILEAAGYLPQPRPDTVARWTAGHREVLPRIGDDVLYWHIAGRPDVLYIRSTYGRDEALALALAFQRSVNGPHVKQRAPRTGVSLKTARMYLQAWRAADADYQRALGLIQQGLSVPDLATLQDARDRALFNWRSAVQKRSGGVRQPGGDV